jgi:hypothetical protein
MFREIGLDEAQMQRWHAIFEQRWPDAHNSFLEWLGEDEGEVGRIRQASRGEWAAS